MILFNKIYYVHQKYMIYLFKSYSTNTDILELYMV